MRFLFISLLSWSIFAQDNAPVTMITNEKTGLKNGCWATLYNENSFQGSSMTIFNGYDEDNFEFSAGPLWRENIKSLVTGPTGQIVFYTGIDHSGQKISYQPASHIRKLPLKDFRSFQLVCVPGR